MSDYFMETQAHEWVLSAQNGAYALGTGNLLNQRKYNGLLVHSDQNFNRIMLVSTIEEKIQWRGDDFFINSASYRNCIYPEGFLHLVKSWLRPYPVFLYSALPHNEDILIKKEILMDEQTSTVLVKYTNLSAHTLHFKIKPLFALRNHHYLNEKGIFDRVHVHSDFNSFSTDDKIDSTFNTFFSVQRIDNNINAFGWLQHGLTYKNKTIYRDVFYPWEAYRGYDATEDLIAPLSFEFELKTNETNYVLFSDRNLSTSDTQTNEDAGVSNIIDEIEKRYKKLPAPFDIPNKRKKQTANEEEPILRSIDYDDNDFFNREDYLKILEFAMRDFLANNDIIAGFPWFGAWGRDTMIAMDGILMLPKGAEIAFSILEKYAKQIKNGLIPNMCSESHQEANYISIDATLWYVIRLYQVCKVLSDTVSETKKAKITRWHFVMRIAGQILDAILEEEHETFFIRKDGLLELNENFASATWMDAKVDDTPVTPRNGAPVEINALLFNAICAYEKMIDEHNEISPDRDSFMTNQSFLEAASSIKEAFNKFWIKDFLADRLIGDEPVQDYRPNAIIASSLPFTDKLLSIDKIQQIYETAHIELFTPYGIRTLSPKDHKYMKKYIGGCVDRDKAYHQGTVWAWLMLPLARTYIWAYPHKSAEEISAHLTFLVQKIRNGFLKGHIASVAEVWDGDKPHFPKGCPAQAWSVAAIYCIEKMIS